MRNSVKFLVILLLFTSCSNKYLFYSLRMTHPVTNNTLYFENDTFAINFEIDKIGIHFSLLNKTYDGIKINWDEVSFSINGQAQRIVHKETGVYKIAKGTSTFDSTTNSIYYQFTKKNTSEVNRYEGEFKIQTQEGIVDLPLSDKIYINVLDSISNSDFCCK